MGRAHEPVSYELGCKVSIVTPVTAPNGGQLVLHLKAPLGNPYDGHILGPARCDTELPSRHDRPSQGRSSYGSHRISRAATATASTRFSLPRAPISGSCAGSAVYGAHRCENILHGRPREKAPFSRRSLVIASRLISTGPTWPLTVGMWGQRDASIASSFAMVADSKP
jgi:hypothetical protein